MGCLLTLLSPILDICSDMCRYVACDCRRDRATLYYGQDVLCALSGYRPVPEEAEGRENGFERSKKGISMIVADSKSFQPVFVFTLNILIMFQTFLHDSSAE